MIVSVSVTTWRLETSEQTFSYLERLETHETAVVCDVIVPHVQVPQLWELEWPRESVERVETSEPFIHQPNGSDDRKNKRERAAPVVSERELFETRELREPKRRCDAAIRQVYEQAIECE